MNTTTARKVNTRPQLIARFAAGDSVNPAAGGAILVYLFETAGAPFFRLIADGGDGELPEHMPTEYATARQAIQAAADLCLTVIYDEVAAIEESGDPEEDAALIEAFAAGQGTRETGAAS
jgi:hypothetical protein